LVFSKVPQAANGTIKYYTSKHAFQTSQTSLPQQGTLPEAVSTERGAPPAPGTGVVRTTVTLAAQRPTAPDRPNALPKHNTRGRPCAHGLLQSPQLHRPAVVPGLRAATSPLATPRWPLLREPPPCPWPHHPMVAPSLRATTLSLAPSPHGGPFSESHHLVPGPVTPWWPLPIEPPPCPWPRHPTVTPSHGASPSPQPCHSTVAPCPPVAPLPRPGPPVSPPATGSQAPDLHGRVFSTFREVFCPHTTSTRLPTPTGGAGQLKGAAGLRRGCRHTQTPFCLFLSHGRAQSGAPTQPCNFLGRSLRSPPSGSPTLRGTDFQSFRYLKIHHRA